MNFILEKMLNGFASPTGRGCPAGQERGNKKIKHLCFIYLFYLALDFNA